MRKRLTIMILSLIALALLAVGCQTSTEPSEPTAGAPRSGRFTVRSPAEAAPEQDPVVVTWTGYTEGHRPGSTSTFTVTLENVGEETTPARFCLSLLDREGIVAELTQREYTLSPMMGVEEEISAEIPDELAAGTYGLALITQDPIGPDAGVVYVKVGSQSGRSSDVPSDVVDEAVEACSPISD